MQSPTSKFKRRTLLSAVMATLLASVTGFSQADSNWNPKHILNAFKSPYSKSGVSIGVISHRGVVNDGCPENSACSISSTYENNIEAIELDVKQSSSGVLWLFHDQNAGRVLYHLPNFYIFQPASNPVGWNPDIRTMEDPEINQAFLRDRNFSKTGYHPVSLTRALTIVRDSANHMIVVLDLKTLEAVARAATLAKYFHMENQVVLKFSASLLANRPNAINEYTQGVAFAPTIYAGDEDRIVDSNQTTFCGVITPDTPYCHVSAWIEQARSQRGFTWLEIGNKQPKSGDPTARLLSDNAKEKQSIGAFSPVPEYELHASDGHHFVRSNGTCCASLNDYLSKTKYFGVENADDRQNFLGQVLMGATSIISDNPLEVIKHVNRDTSRYD